MLKCQFCSNYSLTYTNFHMDLNIKQLKMEYTENCLGAFGDYLFTLPLLWRWNTAIGTDVHFQPTSTVGKPLWRCFDLILHFSISICIPSLLQTPIDFSFSELSMTCLFYSLHSLHSSFSSTYLWRKVQELYRRSGRKYSPWGKNWIYWETSKNPL